LNKYRGRVCNRCRDSIYLQKFARIPFFCDSYSALSPFQKSICLRLKQHRLQDDSPLSRASPLTFGMETRLRTLTNGGILTPSRMMAAKRSQSGFSIMQFHRLDIIERLTSESIRTLHLQMSADSPAFSSRITRTGSR